MDCAINAWFDEMEMVNQKTRAIHMDYTVYYNIHCIVHRLHTIYIMQVFISCTLI